MMNNKKRLYFRFSEIADTCKIAKIFFSLYFKHLGKIAEFQVSETADISCIYRGGMKYYSS